LPSASPRGALLVARPQDYIWFEWADEGVFSLFDRASGETHLISILPAAALRALCDQPMGLAVLAQRLIADGTIDPGADWAALLEQSVDGLLGLQLIAPG